MRMPTSTAPHLSQAFRARRAIGALAASLALTLSLAATPAVSQGVQNGVATLIDSDTLEYDDTKQTSVFTGNVVLTRGDLSLRADRLELRQDAQGNQFATATANGNNQIFVRQVKPGSVEVVEGTGDRAEYDSSKEQILLMGHAVVKRLACGQVLDEIRGERVSYSQKTDIYSASGGPRAGTSNQRVRTMIQSREKSAQVSASCAPAPEGKE